MTVNSLAGRPDSDVVEFAPDSHMHVGDLRRLDAAAQKMRAARSGWAPPSGLRTAPAPSGERINNASELAAALKRSGSGTLQLPSGRTLTEKQLRFLEPEVEKRLGRKLSASAQAPDLAGPVIKVPRGVSAEEWQAILGKPDATVLESPSGKRVTVGDIKQQLATSQERRTEGGRKPQVPQ